MYMDEDSIDTGDDVSTGVPAFRMSLTLATQEQVDAINRVLSRGEQDGELDFAFETKIEEVEL